MPGIRELPANGLGQDSLAELLQPTGLRLDQGEQRVSGRPVDAREAELVRRAPGDWFLQKRRTTRAADDSFAEHAVTLLDPTYVELTLGLG